MGGGGDNLALRQFAGEGLIERLRRIGSTGDAPGLVDVGAASPIVSFPFVVNLDGHLATFYHLLLYGTRCAPFPFLGLVSGFVYCIFSCQSIYQYTYSSIAPSHSPNWGDAFLSCLSLYLCVTIQVFQMDQVQA